MLGIFSPLIFFSGLETILFAADVCAWFQGSRASTNPECQMLEELLSQ